jgi:uncharacterized membrane protein (DUF4010 family)
MAAVLLVTDRSTFWETAQPLLLAGVAAVIYGVLFTIKAANQKPPTAEAKGRAFSLLTALIFAATVSAVLLVSAAVNRWLGSAGLAVAAGLAGFADTHSAAISVASLVAANKIAASEAVLPILIGLTTNTITKAIVALTTGGARFALQIIPGLLLVILAAWTGLAMKAL